jgi:hypothetical protein
MTTIIARISDGVEVERTSSVPTPGLMEAIAINYGGVASDYTFYTLSETEENRISNGDSYVLKWRDGAITNIDFSLENAKGWLKLELSSAKAKVTLNIFDISSVTVYNASNTYLQGDLVFSDKAVYKCQVPSISADDPKIGDPANWKKQASALLLTATILQADKVSVDTTANFTDSLSIRTPSNTADMELTFVNGVCTSVIVLNNTANCGTWELPTDETRVTLNAIEYRVVKQERFKGILPY